VRQLKSTIRFRVRIFAFAFSTTNAVEFKALYVGYFCYVCVGQFGNKCQPIGVRGRRRDAFFILKRGRALHVDCFARVDNICGYKTEMIGDNYE
jgi:hypothetical protein